ncbi:hypothetical protein PPERSA_05946 [Pseudocohnilembus persalinus]|uniref:C2H2-type domain-containing protein n=1 Tax=Pseudocohnilembus persalinus TaxID=266149 RepID=A0A0V0R451_PSEPJ|nr:hypothetical protein PPERSA_05946 [Pseudocohnilembus persalinus]|eukprot:KRX09277.1 hypothetical protein PPERSA_05946 [Pseudocohnilembus persalinus]
MNNKFECHIQEISYYLQIKQIPSQNNLFLNPNIYIVEQKQETQSENQYKNEQQLQQNQQSEAKIDYQDEKFSQKDGKQDQSNNMLQNDDKEENKSDSQQENKINSQLNYSQEDKNEECKYYKDNQNSQNDNEGDENEDEDDDKEDNKNEFQTIKENDKGWQQKWVRIQGLYGPHSDIYLKKWVKINQNWQQNTQNLANVVKKSIKKRQEKIDAHLKQLKDKEENQELGGIGLSQSELQSLKKYVCRFEECGKTYPDSSSLKKHMLTHGAKTFICQVEGCGKKFVDNSKLRRHQLVHTGERTHTGEKPYMCRYPGCDKRFTQSSNLSAHEKSHNSKKDQFFFNNLSSQQLTSSQINEDSQQLSSGQTK